MTYKLSFLLPPKGLSLKCYLWSLFDFLNLVIVSTNISQTLLSVTLEGCMISTVFKIVDSNRKKFFCIHLELTLSPQKKFLVSRCIQNYKVAELIFLSRKSMLSIVCHTYIFENLPRIYYLSFLCRVEQKYYRKRGLMR